MNWIVRKAIGMADITVKIKHSLGTNPQTGLSVPQLDINQSTSMNTHLGGTNEHRYLDWSENPQEDHIFGRTIVQARLIGDEASPEEKARPYLDVHATMDHSDIKKFLRGEIDENLQPCEGFIVEPPQGAHPGVQGGRAGLWVNVVIRDQDAKWVAEQVSPPLSDPSIYKTPNLRSITFLGQR